MFVFSYLKKLKKEYYENLNLQNVTDTKRFWKKVKPVFQNKVKTCSTISLTEKLLLLHQKKPLLKPLMSFLLTLLQI